MLQFSKYTYIWEKQMRNLLMLFIIACLSIGSVSAIEISEFQSKIKTIETQDEQIKYLESIQEAVLSTNNQEIITQYYKDLHWLYYENSIAQKSVETADILIDICLLYTSPSPRD